MYRRVAIGVPALLLILPVGVDACICVSPRSAQPRGAVFVGTAVELVRRVSDPNVGTRRDVRFVVHASWHGPMRDTVTVSSTMTGDCGANYLLGLTYLVVGDYDGRMTITGACDQIRRVSAADDLPEPAWVSAPAGERSFDHSVIEVGQPPPEGEDGWVFLFLEPRTIAVREDRSGFQVQMAQDTARTNRDGETWLRLPVGRYRLRVTPPSAPPFDVDLWLSCGEMERCSEPRFIPRGGWSLPHLP